MNDRTRLIIWSVILVIVVLIAAPVHLQQPSDNASSNRVFADLLPSLPDDIGVAGPIVGIHNDAMIVAGGANFGLADDPQLFDLPKIYHDRAWVLGRTTSPEGQGSKDVFQWRKDVDEFRLKQPVGYSSVVSTPYGVLCLGGENEKGLTNRAFLLSWQPDNNNGGQLIENDDGVPDLPLPCTAGGAALIGEYIYVVAGKVESEDGSAGASRLVWRIALDVLDPDREPANIADDWQPIVSWPDEGPPRMFPLVNAQHDGFTDRLFVMGGRHFEENTDPADLYNLKFQSDCWSFDPTQYDPNKFDANTGRYEGINPWKRIADAPVPITAGTAVPYGAAHIIVPAYATGGILKRTLDSGIAMKDFEHPGFPKEVLSYHTITDTWIRIGRAEQGQVTTPAVRWRDDIVVASGEVRPRIRTNDVWRMRIHEGKTDFGWFNMSIVIIYLMGMLAIGVWFTLRNKTTDDYFRGGKNIPWWAAGCSIFATMLSSITYMAVPAKAFAQDWVYAVGNILILAVAPIAIFVALPFFRGIDATSAYEYLEKRFSRPVRLIGSGSFSLFHVFRMGIVLALAALALASVTPLTPSQCVIVMGVLSIIYCTLGGIEAVIWTDTIQTFILMGGALFCLVYAWMGTSPGSLEAAVDSGKFHLVNFDFSPGSFSTMAIWIVILGGAGQNIASYTADQTVIQRYMTTPDQRSAARSIWLNGLMAIPAGIIFFGMGTAFWMFYRSHPEKLDPTMAADRIMPLFISHELPVGVAGLLVAGIFAAAQSTVSTSMNSGATTIVTDFLRPFNAGWTERRYLWLARLITLLMGVAGTTAGLLFIDPSIKSLFDEFIGILGMFLGVLAGLFALGVTTRRANAPGSLVGATVAILLMFGIVAASKGKVLFGIDIRAVFDSVGCNLYQVNGYLYAFIGITICYLVGYLASLIIPSKPKSLDGLTLWGKNVAE